MLPPMPPHQARSLRWCSESKANGALMRAAPLAVWGHRLPPATLAEYAILDASLSHPSPTCGEASAAYVIALAHLIAQPGDAEGALAAACAWAEDSAGGCKGAGWWPLSGCAPLPAAAFRPCNYTPS